MKKLILITLYLFPFSFSSAQSTDIQHDYDFKVNNDYENYDNTIVDIADWMISTPIPEEEEQRKKYQTFLMNWAAGHPKVKIILNEWTNVSEIGDKNPVLMIIFIASWAKESVETGNYNDLSPLHIASIIAVTDFYLDNRDYLKKDRCIEKYIRLNKKGKLGSWIRKRIE